MYTNQNFSQTKSIVHRIENVSFGASKVFPDFLDFLAKGILRNITFILHFLFLIESHLR